MNDLDVYLRIEESDSINDSFRKKIWFNDAKTLVFVDTYKSAPKEQFMWERYWQNTLFKGWFDDLNSNLRRKKWIAVVFLKLMDPNG